MKWKMRYDMIIDEGDYLKLISRCGEWWMLCRKIMSKQKFE